MATTTEIARAAGVSRVCASLVLNNNPRLRISNDTRKRILQIASEMGYASRRPVAARTVILHVYELATPADRFYGPWHSVLLDEVQRQAAEHDRNVLFIATSCDSQGIARVLRDIDRMKVLGVILDGTASQRMAQQILACSIPLVVTGATCFSQDTRLHPGVCTVSIDLSSGVQRLVEWLCRRGGQNIAFVTNPPANIADHIRIESFRRSIEQLGIRFNPGLIQFCVPGEDGRQILNRFTQLGLSYDAMLFSNLTLAESVVKELRLSSPQRLERLALAAVGGGKDEQVGVLRHVSMVGWQSSQVGAAAYDLLSAEINHRTQSGRHIVLPPQFSQAPEFLHDDQERDRARSRR
jgi:LacI family transcriptional regulator